MKNRDSVRHVVTLALLAIVIAAVSALTLSVVRSATPYGWASTTSDVSPVRSGAAVAQDGTVSPSQVLLFGGKASSGLVNDTWRWNSTAWTKLNPSTSPTARSGATLVYDPAHRQDVLFGGSGSSGLLNDTWVWNGTTWAKLSPSSSPAARQNASAVWDSVRNIVVLFGGASKKSQLQDTWTWNGTTWTQQSLSTKPAARSGAAATFDVVSGTTILFGGTGSKGALADTWRWNGTTWTQLTMTTSPSARSGAGAAFDPITNQIVLFGGLGSAENNDTWTFGATTWTKLTSAQAPSARDSFGFATGGDGSLVLVDGKSGSTAVSGTWVWQTMPGAPQSVTATAQNRQATVSWSALLSGGSPITSYTVTASPGGVIATSTSTSVTVTGLQVATTYTFTVTATNALGTGAASAASNSTTTWAYASAPQNVTATAGNAQATVSWQTPSSDGGSAITGYTVTPYIGATAQPATNVSGTTLSTTISGLTNGTTYTFAVAATTVVGTGPTATSRAVTPVTVPSAPQNVSAVAGNAQATVSWQAPSSTGGSPITGYVVTTFIGTAQQSKTTVDAATNSTTITGLTNGTTYSFSVVATNAAGTGPSSSTSATPSNLPSAPLNVSATASGSDRVTVSWQTPASEGGSPIISYMVTPYQGTTALAPVTTTTSPVTVTGLISSSTYTFSVAATNTNGTGAAATSSPVTTAITACPVAGATDVWTGAAGTTSWTTANNWSASHQPFSTDVACLPAGTFGATSISVPSTTVKQLISYKPLTIASGLTTTNGADFEADATWTGGIFVGPSMMIGSGSTITINGQITLFGSLAVTNAGTVQIVNGTYPIGVSQSCGTGNTASWTNTGTLAFADPGSTAMSLCSGSFTNAVGGIIIHTGAGTDYISSAEISDAGNILSPIGVLVLSTNAGSLTGGTIGGGAGQVVLSGTVSTTSSVIVADNVWVVGTLTGSTVVPAGATLHVGFDANYQVGYASSITGSVNGAGSLSVAGHYYSSIYGPGTTSIATIAADINVPAMTLGDYTAFATKPDGTPTVIGSGTAVNVAGAVTLTGSVAVVNSGAITVSQGYHSANPSNLSGGLSSPCNVPDTPALTNNGSITFTDPYGSASISLCTGSITNTNSGTLGHTASGTDTISAYQLTNAGTVTSQAGVLVWSSPNGQITGGQFAGTPGQIVINGTSTVSSSATVGDNVWVVGTLTGTTTVPAGATLHVGYDAQYQTNVNNSAGIIAGSVNGAGSLSVAGFYYASIYGPGTQSTATVAADLNVASVTMGDYTTFAAKTDGTSLQIGGGTVLNTAGDVTMTGSVAVVNNGTVNVTLGYHAANPYNLSGGIYSPCNVPDTPSWTNGGILNFTDPYGNAAVSLCTGIITNSGFIGHTAPATDSLSAAQLISTGTVTSQAGVLVWSSPNGQLNGGQVSGSTGQVVLAGTTTATVSAVVGDNVWVIGTLGGSTVVPAGATLHVGYDAKYPYSGANAGTISGTVSGAGTLSAAGFYYTSIYGQGTRSTATIAADLNVNTVTLGDYTTFADKPDGSGPQIGSGTNVTVAGDVTLTGSVALVNNGTINVTLGYHAANPYNLNGGIYSPCNVPDTPSLTNAGTLTFTDTGQAAVSLCTGTLTNSGTVGHSGTSTDTITATQLVTTGSIQPQVGVLVWSSTNSSVSGGSVGNGIGQIVLTGTITATNAAAIGDNTWVVNGTLGGTTVISAGATLHVGYDPNYQYNFNGPEGTVTGNVTGAGTLSAVGHYYNNYPFGSNTANAIVAADLNVTNVTLDAYTTLGIKPDSTPTAIDSGTTVTLVTTPTLASNLVLNNAGTIDFHTNGYFTCTTCTVTNQQGGNFIVYNPDGSFTHGFVINAGTFDNEGTIKLTGYMPGTWVVAGPNVTLPNVGLGNGETDGLRQPSWIQNLQTNSTLNQIASSLTQSGGLYSLGNKAIMYAVAALKNIGVGQCVNVNVSLGVPGSSVGLCLVVDPAGNESVAVSVSGGFSGDVSYPPSQNWDASKLLKEPEYSIDAGAMVLWKADPVNGQGFNAYTDLDGLSVCQNGALVSPDFIGVTGQHCWGPEDGVQFKLGILSTNQPGVHSGYVGVVVGTPGATTGMVLSYSVTLSCAQWYSATGQACPPVNATPPSISGTTSVGSTLQVDTGQWTTPDPSQPLTYRYQWGRCTSSSASSCYQISGATSNTYTATDADRNYYLTVWVTATNASGTSQAVAATPVGPVQ